MDLFDVITYRFSLLCIDGTGLCVNRLGDLQGFELCVGGKFTIYHLNANQQMLNKQIKIVTQLHNHQLNWLFLQRGQKGIEAVVCLAQLLTSTVTLKAIQTISIFKRS